MHTMVAIQCPICRSSAKNYGSGAVSEHISGQLLMIVQQLDTAPRTGHTESLAA